ncbi:hypothetical protein VULLAG_LOCUS7444 [Vulpes lagopus]
MQRRLAPPLSPGPAWPQTSARVPRPAARPPDLGARARPPRRRPGRGSDSIPPPPAHLPTAAVAAAGLWLRGRVPGSSELGAEPGARTGARARPAESPAVREGWGIPGDPGRGGVPGRGPGVGSGTGAFSLFRCLKLAPAERCGHVTGRRQSAAAPVSAFRARRTRRRRGAAAGTPPGGQGG